MPAVTLAIPRTLKRTLSRCPVCHAECPAELRRVEGEPPRVFLSRTCPQHGETSVCIASDARFYWLAQGNPANAACGCVPGSACRASDSAPAGTLGRNAPGHGGAPFETLSTCLALIEVVNSCNLACPTCYADSPLGAGGAVDAVPLGDLQRRIQGVIDRKGPIEILQLSGGEPTLHPQFFELLEWAQSNPKILYVLVNTNGVRVAHDDSFAGQLAVATRRGGLQLYLQFDGPQFEGQRFLRDADLRETRRQAVERCRAMNLPVTLAMTVTPENLPFLWSAVEFGLGFPNVRGICFQPLFGSGRLPTGPADPSDPWRPLNVADILLAVVGQSQGRLKFDDFTPLPCGDPNCAAIGYLLKVNGTIASVSQFVDFKQLQGFLHNKVTYNLEDLSRCGCDNEPLGDLLKKFELDESHTFRLLVKPFMDAWSWDQDRIDRCCTHVIRPDGKLDSFCRYYAGFPDTKQAP